MSSIVFIAIEIPSINSHLPLLPLIDFNWPSISPQFVSILWIHLNSSQLFASMIRTNIIPPLSMMTSILKMSVILKSLKDWKMRYKIICSSIKTREILSLINVTVITLRQLTKSFKLNYSDVKFNTQLYVNLNKAQKNHYKIFVSKYWIQIKIYKRQKKIPLAILNLI